MQDSKREKESDAQIMALTHGSLMMTGYGMYFLRGRKIAIKIFGLIALETVKPLIVTLSLKFTEVDSASLISLVALRTDDWIPLPCQRVFWSQ